MPQSLRDNGDGQDGDDPEKNIPPTATITQKAREIQSDLRAITQYDDLDALLQLGLLLESLDAFETETAGLAKAMRSD